MTMDFTSNKPIYRQITDYCFGKILDQTWQEGGRVPSVKELSVQMAVNARTVLRAYEEMQSLDVIYSQRGLGYFISTGARQRVLDELRSEFFLATVPEISKAMKRLDITTQELVGAINKAQSSPNDK